MGRTRKTEEQLQSDRPKRAQRSYVSEIAGNLRRKPDDFPCSPAGRKLYSMKAVELQVLAHSQVMTYDECPNDISAMAAIGAYGNSPQHCREQLHNLFGDNVLAPQPHTIRVPVLKKTTDGQWASSIEECSIFYPHLWFANLAESGNLGTILGASKIKVAEFWDQVQPDDPKLVQNEITKVANWKKLFVPFQFHGDVAPHQKHDGIDCESFRSLLSTSPVDISMLMLSCVTAACKSTAKKCKELRIPCLGDTDEVIGKHLQWSFNALFDGVHPKKDADGKPSTHPKAGQRLDAVNNFRGVIWVAPADNEHNALHYGLPHHSSNNPCMDCPCNTSDIPWRDFSKTAIWRKCIYSAADKYIVRSNCHWLLGVKGFTPSTFGFDPMHTIEIGPAGTAIANVFFDLVYKEFKGTKATKLERLNQEIKEAYKELGIKDNKFGRLFEYKHFCSEDAPHKNWPDLMHSVVKARQTRYLVPVAAKLCRKYLKRGDSYSEKRCACLESLAESHDIVDRNGLFLGPETDRHKECLDAFVENYAALRKLSGDAMQWPLRPKLHYICHIAEASLWLSPRAFWCYAGESMVGTVASLAASCLRNTAPHQVSVAVCSKYMLGKHLQFKFEL